MKQIVALLICCILILSITGCNKKIQTGNLSTLTADDVSAVTVLALSEESMCEIVDPTEINEILCSLQSIELSLSDNKSKQYSNDLVQFTLKKNNGSCIILGILSPYVCIDNIWYQTDNGKCEQLCLLANKLLINR